MTSIHAIRSKRVVTPEGIRAATVHVRNGVIQAIAGYNDLPSGKHIYDAEESVVMPGLVDTHVHINEPGRTEWEGFDTATRAAAAGGRRACRRVESFPFGATRLVDVDMRVHKAWHDHGFFSVVNVFA